MDLALYARLVWRYRTWFAAVAVLAVVLSLLSYARIGPSGITPRGSETWQAKSTLLISQEGFPYGRAVPRYQTEKDSNGPAVLLGDQNRFAALSQVYAQLANSDVVRTMLNASEPVNGTVSADAAVDPNGMALPLLNITAIAPTLEGASRLAASASSAFRDYVARRQQDAGIAAADRVELQVLNSGQHAILVAPRKKTLPMLVFFAVMAAAFGIVLVLENQRRAAAEDSDVRAGQEVAVHPHHAQHANGAEHANGHGGARPDGAPAVVDGLPAVRGVAAAPAEPSQRLA
ncbi:MAG TPA: hypothetical protein VFT50_10350 [Baekduia sp.]|nr:hypothetical protein [Baekduia sp.]